MALLNVHIRIQKYTDHVKGSVGPRRMLIVKVDRQQWTFLFFFELSIRQTLTHIFPNASHRNDSALDQLDRINK
jgi:hypothetical protein